MQKVSLRTNLLKPYLILFILIVLKYAGAQTVDYKSITGKSYGERQLFLFNHFYSGTSFRQDSTKYFQEVGKLLAAARQVNDIELVYEAEFLRLNFLSSKKYPQYLSEAQQLLDKVDRQEITQLQARVRQAIGLHYLYEKDNFKEAYIYLTDSYPYLQKLSLNNLPDKQELLYNIAYVNYTIGYESKALKLLEEAEALENNYYPTLECNIKHTQGLIHEQNDNLNTAIDEFNKVLELSLQIKNTLWTRVAKNSIARVLLNQEKYEEALTYLTSPPELNTKESEEAIVVESRRLMLLGKVLIAQKRWEELSAITPTLKNLLTETKIPIRLRKEIYHVLAVNEEKKGNFKVGYFYKDSALTLANKYFKIKNDQGLKQTLEKERIEAVEKEKIYASHQRKIALITRTSLSVILLLIITGSALLFTKQKKKYKRKRKEVEDELTESKLKLNELLSDLKSKNKEVEAYEEELEKLHQNLYKDEDKISEKQKILETLLSKPMMTDSQWLVFKRAFDKVHPEYFMKLQKSIPNISQAETRYMYFRKLNLSPKEIAYTLGISQGSIRQYKHRIRSKININSEESLDHFLDNI